MSDTHFFIKNRIFFWKWFFFKHPNFCLNHFLPILHTVHKCTFPKCYTFFLALLFLNFFLHFYFWTFSCIFIFELFLALIFLNLYFWTFSWNLFLNFFLWTFIFELLFLNFYFWTFRCLRFSHIFCNLILTGILCILVMSTRKIVWVVVAMSTPNEVYRKDLVSAMLVTELPECAQTFLLQDNWKTEWERGVQVPAKLKQKKAQVSCCAIFENKNIHFRPNFRPNFLSFRPNFFEFST